MELERVQVKDDTYTRLIKSTTIINLKWCIDMLDLITPPPLKYDTKKPNAVKLV